MRITDLPELEAAKISADDVLLVDHDTGAGVETKKVKVGDIRSAVYTKYYYENVTGWLKIGTLTKTHDADDLIVDLYFGQGFGGETNQNTWFRLYIRDAYQSKEDQANPDIQSKRCYAMTGFVLMGGIRKAYENIKIQLRATGTGDKKTSAELWINFGFPYATGSFTASGAMLKNWTPSGELSDSDPTVGVIQEFNWHFIAGSLQTFPIGSVFTTVSSDSPASFLGGSWEKLGKDSLGGNVWKRVS